MVTTLPEESLRPAKVTESTFSPSSTPMVESLATEASISLAVLVVGEKEAGPVTVAVPFCREIVLVVVLVTTTFSQSWQLRWSLAVIDILPPEIPEMVPVPVKTGLSVVPPLVIVASERKSAPPSRSSVAL